MALHSTCTAVGYFKSWFQKKKLKLDCSEFGAVEINRVVDSTAHRATANHPLSVLVILSVLVMLFIFQFCVIIKKSGIK